MVSNEYLKLAQAAMPCDVSIEDLKGYGKSEWWQNKPRLALAYALRKCGRINWEAYKYAYPDVKQVGVDPCLHFIRNGVLEGRKLKSFYPSCAHCLPRQPGAPHVTVIVPSYNNSVFLEKCLNSLAGQTLKEIEIIVVDDCSTDDSLAIARSFAARDKRFKVIAFDINKSQHMAKKTAVAAATGDYVMFCDSDDFYRIDACEAAWKTAIQGYDIVMFGVHIVNHAKHNPSELASTIAWLNSYPFDECSGANILNHAFRDNILRRRLTNKIFDRCLCQDAFHSLEDGYFTLCEDYYQFLALGYMARNFKSIKDKLYNSTIGIGTTGRANKYNYNRDYLLFDGVLIAIRKFCQQYKIDNMYAKLIDESFKGLFYKIIPFLDCNDVTAYFDRWSSLLGKDELVIFIKKYLPHRLIEIARKFAFYRNNKREIKHVGIFYFRISQGGVERTILNMANALKSAGFKVSLFLEEKSRYDLNLANDIDIYYLSPESDSYLGWERHIRDLFAGADRSKIDVMLYMWAFNPLFFWDLLLLKLMGVRVIGAIRSDHNLELIERGKQYAHSQMLATLRCADKVSCLKISTDLYLKAQGIDSVYIPNTIRKLTGNSSPNTEHNNIVVIARLKDTVKRIPHNLMILAEVLKEIPDATMTFVGDFDQKKAWENFLRLSRELDLIDRISVTGWVEDVGPYLDEASVMLSTSFIEGFPNAIAEAQANGLPVVMYDIDIEMAKDNESIIRVPQGGIKQAAAEIVALFKDNKRRRKLAQIARDKANEFSELRFSNGLIDLLNTFQTSSTIKSYSPAEYQTALRYMAFYAGKHVSRLS